MINEERIAQLRNDLGPALFTDLAELLLQEIEEKLAMLGPDMPGAQFRVELLAIGDCAADLGFSTLATTCLKNAEDCADFSSCLQSVHAIFAHSRDQLERGGFRTAA
ncbi:hypothetical protein [Brevirhabdus sp.]|uniref:hypothetical protein n=1 Tax=Brevirhabdus sp. TaxID=2004514 RepID=UPI0040593C9D